MPFDDDPVFEPIGVKDGQLVDDDGVTDLALRKLETLGDWSDWVRFADALAIAPKVPGVYLAREDGTGALVYTGLPERGEGGDYKGG